jgi:hypothetical protein
LNGVKVCSVCEVEKPFSGFSLNRSTRDGRQAVCKVCTHTHRMRKRYGSDTDVAAIRALGCEICGSEDRVFIDHCHDSGVVRGALCHRHNSALGFCRDDPRELIALAAYAEKHAHLKLVA